MPKIKCLVCGEIKEYWPSEIKKGAKFCSLKCYWKFSKLHPNKGTFYRGSTKNELNSNWKGDGVGYWALHDWVQRRKGKPKICIDCGATPKERRLYWSNINHKYLRNTDDYQARCASCHKLFDLKNNLNQNRKYILSCTKLAWVQ